MNRNPGKSLTAKRPNDDHLSPCGALRCEVSPGGLAGGPRDRAGTFEPQIVRKRRRRLSGVDEMVLSLYAKGLTTGEISAHFAEIYGVSVSKETISRITDKVTGEMTDWCNRPYLRRDRGQPGGGENELLEPFKLSSLILRTYQQALTQNESGIAEPRSSGKRRRDRGRWRQISGVHPGFGEVAGGTRTASERLWGVGSRAPTDIALWRRARRDGGVQSSSRMPIAVLGR